MSVDEGSLTNLKRFLTAALFTCQMRSTFLVFVYWQGGDINWTETDHMYESNLHKKNDGDAKRSGVDMNIQYIYIYIYIDFVPLFSINLDW